MTNKKWKLLTYTSLVLMMASPVSSTVLALENTDASNIVSGEKQDSKETTHNTTTGENKSNTKKETPTTKVKAVEEPKNDFNKLNPAGLSLDKNGEIGQKLLDKAIQNANRLEDDKLNDALEKNGWNIIRSIASDYGSFKGALGNWTTNRSDGSGYSILFGNLNVGLVKIGSGEKPKVISSEEVYSLDRSEYPTESEIKSMTDDEKQKYVINGIPIGIRKTYISDDNSHIGLDSREYGKAIISSKNQDLNYQYDIGNFESSNINSTVLGLISRDPNSSYQKLVGTDLASSNIKGSIVFGSSDYYTHGNLYYGSMTNGVLSGSLMDSSRVSDIATLKSTDPITLSINSTSGPAFDDPASLIDAGSLTTDDGTKVDLSDVGVTWKIAPDVSQVTTDGSAVLQLHDIHGDTYLRVPYVVKDIQPVTVKYVDETGNSIYADQTINPTNEGDPYDASTSQYKLDTLTGTDGKNYHLDTTKLPDNATGVFGEQPVTVTYTYKANQTAMTVHNSELYVGDAWKSQDNWDSTLDMDGKSVDFAEVQKNGKIEGNVDTTTAGTYKVKYSYQDAEATATIVVKDNQSTMKVHNSTIYVGDSWLPKDNWDSATYQDGSTVDFSNIVTDKLVDTTKAGVYKVNYSIKSNPIGLTDLTALATATATITVKDNLTAIDGSDVTKYVGDAMPADSEFKASATDKDGNAASLTIDKSKVDMTKPGDYDVVLSSDNGMTKTVQVHVLANQQSIKGSDVTKYVGGAMPKDSEFKASATDKDGKNIAVTLDKSRVDMNTVGDYDVVITAADGQTKNVQVHVLADQRSIKGTDVTKHVGDKLPADSEFKASAVDIDGNVVSVKIDKSKVDMTKAGDYDVVITADDGQKLTVQVHVLPDLRTIKGSDVTKYVGDAMPTDAEFKASATDIDGNNEAVTLDKSKVDMTKAGDYDVKIIAPDGQAKTVQVHVLADKRTIKGSDVTKHIGDAMPEDSEFKASATDKDGNDIVVTLDKSQVDMNTTGDYDVVITATDGQTKTVQVHVLPDLRSIDGSDVNKYVGDELPTDVEFKASATDIDGKSESITFDKSQVDMSQVGDYDVTLTAKDGQTKTVQVHVRASKVIPETATVIVKYLDEEGNTISKNDILQGQPGEKYTTKAKDITGYLLTGEPKNKDGVFVKGTTVVEYRYEKEPTKPTKPTDPKDNTDKKTHPANAKNKKQTLPQTGEAVLLSSVVTVAGVTMLLFATYLILGGKKKSNE